jgi:hypothetical protein
MSVDHSLQTIQQASTRHTPDERQVLRGLHRPSLTPVTRGLLQRQCACGDTPGVDGECAACRTQRLGLQRYAVGTTAPLPTPPIVQEVLRSPGQPLDKGTRAFMESRFGYDFSQVRIHTDTRAAESARAVHALAYTVGRDMVFGAGQYAPEMARGRELLAHELAHVVQQASAPATGMLEVADAGNAPEREAAAAASQVLSAGQAMPQVPSHTPAQIARQDDAGAAAGAAPASPSRVDLIRVSCESNTIAFETDAGVYVYDLTDCEIEDADYLATVTVEGNNVNFSPPPDAPGAHARFPYRIEPGQPNPSTFFGGQTTVRIVTGAVPGPSPAPGPGPAARTMICSKRLQAPVVGWFANHAYIDDTGSGDCRGSSKVGNYAIQTLVSGNFLRGCAAKTDTSDDPQSYTPNVKECTPKAGVTDLHKCLRDAYTAYADPSVYANPRGPNSNTFAATLARTCCADSSSSGLGWVPGWKHAPAPPCPSTSSGPILATGLGESANAGEDLSGTPTAMAEV